MISILFGVLRFSNFREISLPSQDEDKRAVGNGVTTATLPVFSRPGFTKDGKSSVLGFANAPVRSLRIYDWTYQYADHETWSEAPSSSLSLLASFFVPWNLLLPISL